MLPHLKSKHPGLDRTTCDQVQWVCTELRECSNHQHLEFTMQKNKQDVLMKGNKKLGKVKSDDADRNQQMVQPSRQDGPETRMHLYDPQK